MSHKNEIENDMELKINLLREFNIVFQPNNREEFDGRRRFLVSGNRLAEYIGVKNANDAIQRAWESGEDKFTRKFRKLGKVDFYTK